MACSSIVCVCLVLKAGFMGEIRKDLWVEYGSSYR